MKILKWIRHWFLQGLKVMLFGFMAAVVAGIVFAPFQFLAAMLRDWELTFSEPPLLLSIAIVALHAIAIFLGLALFAFVLAAQLKDHPLCGPAEQDEASNEQASEPKKNLTDNEAS